MYKCIFFWIIEDGIKIYVCEWVVVIFKVVVVIVYGLGEYIEWYDYMVCWFNV